MRRRNINRVYKAAPARTSETLQIRLILLAICCLAVVAAGFFFAARQHFATMEFGLKNSELRNQVELLEAERRRLILAKEVSLSPSEIRETASKLGFREEMTSPPSSADLKAGSPGLPAAPTAELTSLKLRKETSNEVRNPGERKKLIKPIVQQTNLKPPTANERPRIASTEKVVAAVTVSGPASNPK